MTIKQRRRLLPWYIFSFWNFVQSGIIQIKGERISYSTVPKTRQRLFVFGVVVIAAIVALSGQHLYSKLLVTSAYASDTPSSAAEIQVQQQQQVNKNNNNYTGQVGQPVAMTVGSEYLELNASNFVDITSNSSLQLEHFTLSAWFKTSQSFLPGSYHHFIVNKGGLGLENKGYNMNYGIWMDDRERIQGGFETASGDNHFLITPNSYNDGKWHHATLTYNGSIMFLYIDGKEVGKRLVSAIPDSQGSQPVSIGVNSLTINGFFIGAIDEVRIWSEAISDDEIIKQYESRVFDEQGQMLYASFEDAVME